MRKRIMTLGPKTTTGDRGDKAFAPARSIRRLMALASTALLLAAAHAQSTYTINATLPATVPAGAAGVTLALSGTFPDFSQNAYKVCFYTGSGSAAPLTPVVTAGVTTIAVTANTIQAIPPSNFTAANGYSVPALVSIVPTGTICDGTFNASLTNSLSVPIVEPVLTAFVGPSVVPQTNATTNTQAPPTTILLSGNNFAANTTVSFQNFPGTVTRVLTPTSLSVTVPAAFSASSSDTTSTLTVCNSGSGAATFCSASDPPFTVALAPLYPSSAFLTVSPSPTTTARQTTLTAQISKGDPANPLPEPGAPSGTVTFGAGSTAIPARLILDPTATFVQQTSLVTTPVTPTPTITPAAGSYLNSVTVSIADSAPGASIFYTQDGSTPTAASTPYTAPFQITASQTIQAIAASSGALNSAVAAVAYTITISPPSKLAFAVQPASAPIATAIAPPIQVAIQDVNGNTVTSSTLPVTLALAANPGQSTLSGTRTVNAVNGIATFSDLTLNNIATGYTLTATSASLTPATSAAFNITPPPITMAVQSALIGINSTLTGTVTLGQAAATGGVAVTLSSNTPANVTISPATLTIPAGQTVGNFTYTGVAAGNATLSAAATNYQTGTVQVTGTAAQVSLGTIPAVAPGQSVSLALSLPSAAPPGGTTVTFTSSNTNVATVTSSIFVPAGQRTATTNPQITGIVIGTTNIVASAPGYAPDSRAVNVTVVASFSPTTSSINLATSTNTTLNISAPAPAGGIAFSLTSDAPGTATVGSTVTVPAGATSVPISLTGVSNGTTTIRANSPGVTEATGTVNVTSTLAFNNTAPLTGVNLETTIFALLPVAPPNPVTVTVTSNGPAIATIAKTGTDVGGTTLTFTNVTSTASLAIYVQGQSLGTTTLTVSAPGYTNGTATVTVNPSGFGFINNFNFSTTTFSQPTTVRVYPIILNPGSLTYNNTSSVQVNPGIGAVSVPVISGTTSVGTITTSPVVFNGGDSSQTTTFQPIAAGTSTLTITTPSGFSTPSQSRYTQITATVTAPTATFSNSTQTTGVNTETLIYAGLPVAPPNPVTVTVTSNNPAIATISKSGTVVGGTTLTFTNVTSAGNSLPIYVQGQSLGTTTLTVSAPGYTDGTATITVNPSGFAFINSSNFSTTTFSQPTSVRINPVVLNPGTLAYNLNGGVQVNPGIGPVNVPVVSGTTSVGTITTSPVVFNGGDSSQTTTFQPVAAGTSNLTLTTPSGFSSPSQSQYTQITATVTAPAAAFNNTAPLTGVNLETTVFAQLPVAPPNPVTVTVTSNGPAIATISKTGTVVGGTTLTFTNVTSTSSLPIYVQGQSLGTTTLTLSAPGYTNGTATVTVNPSGFAFINSFSFSTTTFSQPTSVRINPVVLNSGSLTYNNTTSVQVNPGIGTVSVPITSGTTSVGTITTSPVVFNGGDSSQSTTFQPVAAGTSNLTLTTPSGFSTPSQSQNTQITATVTAPAAAFNNTAPLTGVNLETTVFAQLPVAPPNPVTVTVTSNGPAIATISKTGTVVGGTTLTFTNVTSTASLAIYVQGQALGSTTLTVSAPGYTNGTTTVTVNPSGFAIINSFSFSTTTFSQPTSVRINPVVLNSGSLTYNNTTSVQVNPGIGTVSVPVASGTTSVGTITTSPVVFNGGDSSQSTTFQPVAAGTSNLTLTTPSGFSTPSQSQYTQITATVTAPAASINPNTTGVNLQTTVSASLQTSAPNPVTVTVTSSDPTIATLSASPTVGGAATLTFTNVTSSIPTIYVQGQAVGTATLTVSAPGYTNGTGTETVNPSGFAFNYTTSVSTTTTSSPTTLTVNPFILNTGSLTVQSNGQLNPGQTVTVPVTSSNPATGVITTSPLVFNSGDTSKSTTFRPLTTGTTTLTVQPPPGFSTPSQYQQITATVQ